MKTPTLRALLWAPRLSLLPIAAALAGLVRADDAPPFKSVEVSADGRITFRYVDKGAATVMVGVTGIRKPLAMTKSGAGIWSATTPPLPPETYAYSFTVDGLAGLDPHNLSVAPNLVWPASLVAVEGPAPRMWDPAPVPHGELHHHFYTTSIAKGLPGDQNDYIVYTPPGYDPHAARPYPVLFLLHGWSDTTEAWVKIGGANFVLDNLIAQGRAKPMVIVMPLGYTSMAVGAGRVGLDRNKLEGAPAIFGNIVLEELLPRVEAEYRVSRDRRCRAIAGLSMGGEESLVIGLTRPDAFAWVGAFSAGGLKTDLDAKFPGIDPGKAGMKLLWIACGKADSLLGSNREFATWLTGKGFAVTEVETEGGHEWHVWHDNLIHFAPLLFQGN
jgi:enterochelin esterase family protein